MKLTKIFFLALGLMAISATGALAQDLLNASFQYTGGAPRIIATNSDTGETTTVQLTSQNGNEEDPAWLPGSAQPDQVKESIYLNYTHTISALSDIRIQMFLPGGNAYLESPYLNGYGTWRAIDRSGTDIAQARVGNTPGVASNVLQIQFLQDTSFWDGSVIEVSGVRVNLNGASPGGEEVFVSFTTAEGSAGIFPETVKVARSTDPLTCVDCAPTVTFRSDGRTIDDMATLTIRELFHNAFEAPTQIRLRITNIPQGYEFEGIDGVTDGPSDNVDIAGYGCNSPIPTTVGTTCWINISDNNPGTIEQLFVRLEFDLIGIPVFNPPNANIYITQYPAGSGPMPWTINNPYTYPLRYSSLEIRCTVSFAFEEFLGGRLLSVFNTYYSDIWDTGFGVMNGSGAEPLEPYRDWWGHWWDIPQYGTVTVYVYPQDTAVIDNPDSPYVFTTGPGANHIGLGLDANGRVPPKGEWTVLLSEILALAKNDDLETHSGDFSGFVIFETNFPLAEGVNYVTDWDTQAQGYPMINLMLREEEGRRWYQSGR